MHVLQLLYDDVHLVCPVCVIVTMTDTSYKQVNDDKYGGYKTMRHSHTCCLGSFFIGRPT